MRWNFTSDVPIYLQIMAQLKKLIASGMLLPGDRLQSVRELAAEANVNPNTMQKALTELEREELVFSQRTSGRYITDNPEKLAKLRHDLADAEIERFCREMTSLGYSRNEAANMLADACENESHDKTL